MIIRDAAASDEMPWRQLWAGYTDFYNVKIADAVTNQTWRRILDPSSAMFARLAEDNGAVIGFSISVLHAGTWSIDPICYLEDLFVAPGHRRRGTGRRLIQDLIDTAHTKGWSRLYWHTHGENPARHLYEQFAGADGFVRYRLIFT
ncbi:MAG: GNAT family N-acetyltransferase [Rhodospirillales bacterium]|nr:GNAT family N-acetyltransferase [Rhodospirillales bacterium]